MALVKDQNDIFLKEDKISSINTQFSAELQDEYFTVEDNSWWFQYKFDVVSYLADKYFSKESNSFDIGGGNGYFAGRFIKAGYNMGLIEPAYEACLNAKKRGVNYLINGSINDVDFEIQQCTCLDVLEHVNDDKEFLKSIYIKMSQGGTIILTVPAFMSLWSSEDVKLGHFRRYKCDQLIGLFEKTGFKVHYANYYFSFLYMPIFLIRVMLEKLKITKRSENLSFEENVKREANQHKKRTGLVNTVLGFFEKREMDRIKKGKKIPFGSSVIIVAKKDV